MSAARRPALPGSVRALWPFLAAGVFSEADFHVAAAIARTSEGVTRDVALAAALCVRALRHGHTCVDLHSVAETVDVEVSPDGPPSWIAGIATVAAGSAPPGWADRLVWPEPSRWAESLEGSRAVARHDPLSGERMDSGSRAELAPLVFDGRRVYLERYWRYERRVGDFLTAAAAGAIPAGETRAAECCLDAAAAVESALDRYFGQRLDGETDMQREGARRALLGRVTFLAGGPGTGKTHTVARLLAAAVQSSYDTGLPARVAVAAPTGKAASRMTEAVRAAVEGTAAPEPVAATLLAVEARTVHRLLGHVDGVKFRHDATNPLPYQLVVVDETSMVDLALMARLVDALGERTRLVLVGDPYQLASVEAGAVLGDVVGPAARGDATPSGPLSARIVVLDRVHRFAAESAISAFADAVKARDADRSIDVLRDPSAVEVTWVDPGDAAAVAALRAEVTAAAGTVVAAARAGDASNALRACVEVKVLCATRFGVFGSLSWGETIEAVLAAHSGRSPAGWSHGAPGWYVGRPVIVTANDYLAGVFNGDTGVVISRSGGGERSAPSVALAGSAGIRLVAPSQLASVETWWATTIHKSQGSEFAHVVVSLPDATSRALTNELLYTAVTRATRRVTVLASEESLRRAVSTPVARSSGLGERLWRSQPTDSIR